MLFSSCLCCIHSRSASFKTQKLARPDVVLVLFILPVQSSVCASESLAFFSRASFKSTRAWPDARWGHGHACQKLGEIDKGLSKWTRVRRDGQGLVELDKRARRHGQGLVGMDKGEATQGHDRSDKGSYKGLASDVKDLANRRTLARDKKCQVTRGPTRWHVNGNQQVDDKSLKSALLLRTSTSMCLHGVRNLVTKLEISLRN